MGALDEWMAGYLKAWDSNDPDDIRALFTEDAVLKNEPFTTPFIGHDAIVAEWLRRSDGSGSYSFDWTPLTVTVHLAVITGETHYATGVTYSNLWVIRLATDGRAREFTEWWMDQSNPS